MNITAEEKLMYRVMAAVFGSAVPVSFKGSMVLKACLIEAGYSGEIRHTVDIDANWNSNIRPSIGQMEKSLQKAMDSHDLDLRVCAYREYGEGRSAGFEIKDAVTDEILFTMDVDVNRPKPPTRLYDIDGIRFCGAAPVQIVADKLCVISSDKVFRRIKDIVDLYYISSGFEFDRTDIFDAIKNSGRTLERFNGFIYRVDELKHSYEKFRFEGGVSKPPFEEVYNTVKRFIGDILPPEDETDKR